MSPCRCGSTCFLIGRSCLHVDVYTTRSLTSEKTPEVHTLSFFESELFCSSSFEAKFRSGRDSWKIAPYKRPRARSETSLHKNDYSRYKCVVLGSATSSVLTSSRSEVLTHHTIVSVLSIHGFHRIGSDSVESRSISTIHACAMISRDRLAASQVHKDRTGIAKIICLQQVLHTAVMLRCNIPLLHHTYPIQVSSQSVTSDEPS